jgi:hypothetical protein
MIMEEYDVSHITTLPKAYPEGFQVCAKAVLIQNISNPKLMQRIFLIQFFHSFVISVKLGNSV